MCVRGGGRGGRRWGKFVRKVDDVGGEVEKGGEGWRSGRGKGGMNGCRGAKDRGGEWAAVEGPDEGV